MNTSGGSARAQADILVSNRPEDIRAVQQEIVHAIEQFEYSDASVFAVRLALEEALSNAFRHGHRDKPDEPIRVSWNIGRDHVTLRIRDRGPGFEPDELPDPTADDRLELPAGRGVMLMRAYMTKVIFSERGNDVTLIYDRPRPDSSR